MKFVLNNNQLLNLITISLKEISNKVEQLLNQSKNETKLRKWQPAQSVQELEELEAREGLVS